MAKRTYVYHSLSHHLRLIAILLIYLVLAVAHSLIVPFTTGNDEWAHFLYLRFIAEQGHLPATSAERNEAGYKSDAPPLYHLLTAAATAGVEPTRLLRPLSSDQPRRYLADNLIRSYALLHTAVEQFPLHGEALLWQLGRGLSILFGLILIVVTYLTGLLVFPASYRRATTAAAVVAFTPAFIFHSSVLSYESLSAVMAALFLLAALKCLVQPRAWRWWLAMGLAAGLAITTKYSAVLLPLEICFVAWLIWTMPTEQGIMNNEQRARIDQVGLAADTASSPRNVQLAALFWRLMVAGLVLVLVTSWWFGFVVRNFNTVERDGWLVGVLQPLLVGDASDTTSVQVAGFLFGPAAAGEPRPPLARNYLAIAISLLESFWAAPINERFLLSPGLPILFTLLAMLAGLGLWRARPAAKTPTRSVLWLLLLHTLLILPLLLVRVILAFDAREVAQGRHIFLPAASAIALLLVWGWWTWSPKIGQVVVAGLLLWSSFGQVLWAAAIYPAPITVWPQPPVAQSNALPQQLTFFDGAIRLNAADWEQDNDSLIVTLWWESAKTVPEDYLVELTLQSEAGEPAGYHLGHPVRGRYPTRAWEPGDVVKDVHVLPLNVPQAGQYTLELRLLPRAPEDWPAGSGPVLGQLLLTAAMPEAGVCAVWPKLDPSAGLRPNTTITVVAEGMPTLHPQDGGQPLTTPYSASGPFHTFLVGYDWPTTAELRLGPEVCALLNFDIPKRNFTLPSGPQPLLVNFNDQLQLLGIDLPTRRIQAGERLPLTLYWQALAYIGEDYRIFANPLDANQRRWGGYDRRPQDGYSTLRLVPGQVITDPFGIPVAPDAPDGIYTIDLGLYRQTAAGAESLPLYRDGQPQEQRSIRLGPIKVGGSPDGVVIAHPEPQIPLTIPFGEQITLIGYSLDNEQGTMSNEQIETEGVNREEGLKLTLFWQADGFPAADYTTFVHVRDEANQTVAQKDGPPAAGRYPSALWDPGEVIADEINLPLADLLPGVYTIVVGLYNPVTGERLEVPDNPVNERTLQRILIEE